MHYIFEFLLTNNLFNLYIVIISGIFQFLLRREKHNNLKTNTWMETINKIKIKIFFYHYLHFLDAKSIKYSLFVKNKFTTKKKVFI